MYEYVGEYISHYYSSNEDVINDNEIRDWIREIEENGHPNHKSEFIEMKTLADLQKFITTIIWTASCYHSVIYFSQYKMYGFVPNYQFALFQPIAYYLIICLLSHYTLLKKKASRTLFYDK